MIAACDQESAGFDAIGDNVVLGTVQFLYAFDDDPAACRHLRFSHPSL